MGAAAREFFKPFGYVNPAHPHQSVAEIERCVSKHRMCGVKLWVAVKASDLRVDPIMHCAESVGVPVLQHAWRNTLGGLPGESTPADVADLARRHADVNIIMAHLNGAGLRGIEDVADCPNVFVDTSGGDPESGIVEAAVAALGPSRVVYGSDAAIRHFGTQMGKVLGADIADAVKQDILWNNAARLLPEWAGVDMAQGDCA